MDYQSWIEGINGKASLYAFDILPDGTYSEIRLMAVNQESIGMVQMNPDAPEFYPGIPYRTYWMDLNFENFVYKCADTLEPLYSYVNARGIWLKGFYIPIADIWTDVPPMQKEEGLRTVYCLYVVHFTERADTESMIQRPVAVSNAVLDIGIRLHDSMDFYQSMADVAVSIGEFCGAESCAIYTVDKDSGECSFINKDGLQNQFMEHLASEMKRTPLEVADAWKKDLALSDCMILEDLSVIEERDPVWYRSMCAHNIHNIVLFAIQHNQQIVGFIWVVNYDVDRREYIKEILELTSFWIAAFIANHHLLSKLEQKSATDVLTQVENRNAMVEYISGFTSGVVIPPEQMGVVFVDLNGLKVINDEEGHSEGDKLLIRASSLIKVVFAGSRIFRSGGDEFVVFCENITEVKLSELVSQLKVMAETTSDVSIAVGSAWRRGGYDINDAIKNADELMYQDKKAYYSTNPHKNRRS